LENIIVQNTLPQHGTPAQVIDVPAVSVPPIQIPPVVLTPDQTLCYMAGSASTAERERKRHRDMTICGTLDAFDLCLGWIPVVGQLLNVINAIACVSMFGPKGFLALLEMIDLTGIVGAFVPTCTLVGRSYWKEH
jgi:hypothetical protein